MRREPRKKVMLASVATLSIAIAAKFSKFAFPQVSQLQSMDPESHNFHSLYLKHCHCDAW